MIDRENDLSISRQAEVLQISRRSVYIIAFACETPPTIIVCNGVSKEEASGRFSRLIARAYFGEISSTSEFS